LLFLYRHVLEKDLVGSIDAVHAKKPERLPTVLTKDEALEVIGFLSSKHRLMAKLLYGSGLRLTECIRLRVKPVLSPLSLGQRTRGVAEGPVLSEVEGPVLNRGAMAVRSPLD